MARTGGIVLALAGAGLAVALAWPRDGREPGAVPDPAANAGREGLPPAQTDRPSPAAGALRIEQSGHGLTVLGARVRRMAVLEALGAHFGFAVRGAPEAPDPLIDVAHSDADLESVLLAVLAGVPHSLRYAPDASGKTRLVRVDLGLGPTPSPDARAADAPVPVASPRSAQREPRSNAGPEPGSHLPQLAGRLPVVEREQVRRDREQRDREDAADSLLGVTSADPGERARAVAALDAGDGEGFDALSEALLHDPSSRVRVRAARHMGFADADRALPVLTRALADPDPEVVHEVIESILFQGDVGAIAALERLRTHPNPGLRAAALDAIDTLE